MNHKRALATAIVTPLTFASSTKRLVRFRKGFGTGLRPTPNPFFAETNGL
jgi:hypothetical protein